MGQSIARLRSPPSHLRIEYSLDQAMDTCIAQQMLMLRRYPHGLVGKTALGGVILSSPIVVTASIPGMGSIQVVLCGLQTMAA